MTSFRMRQDIADRLAEASAISRIPQSSILHMALEDFLESPKFKSILKTMKDLAGSGKE